MARKRSPRLDRLGDIAVHARLQAALPIALDGVGSHRDDRDVPACPPLSLADAGRRLEAIHLGHLHVHQDQVEGLLLPGGEGLLAIAGDVHRVPALLQEDGRQRLVDEVVLHQQDSEAPRRSRQIARLETVERREARVPVSIGELGRRPKP